MLNVFFFASIRERLQIERLQLHWPLSSVSSQQISDIDAVVALLVREYGALWQEVLCADNVIVALNQRVVERSTGLSDGDELAFFPPVTGG